MRKENGSIIKQLSITPESLETKKIIKQPEIIYSSDLKKLSQKAFDEPIPKHSLCVIIKEIKRSKT